MAQRIRVVLQDDLDHSQASHTILFAVDGACYEIDLNDQHATQLRDTFAPWVEHSRTMSKNRSRLRLGRATINAQLRGAGADRFRAAAENA